MNTPRVEALIKELLVEIGEDPSREGLAKTPSRVAKSFQYLLSGYQTDPATVVNDAVFESEANNMIIVKDLDVYSMCEHHMLPFFGKCHIGYIAQKKVLGVSKLARIVECYARRLQIQERLTSQIAKAVMEAVDAEGVGVVIECQHLCMVMRGVEKQGSVMTTSSVLGSFYDEAPTRSEFLTLLGRSAR